VAYERDNGNRALGVVKLDAQRRAHRVTA